MRHFLYRTDTGVVVSEISHSSDPIDHLLAEGLALWSGEVQMFPAYIIDDTPQNPLPTAEELLNQIRLQRNLLLQESDWTQVADAPVDKQLWALYRQVLRDFPSTCDPNNPVWPTQP